MTDIEHPHDFRCAVCGEPACFGFGVALSNYQRGTWYCPDHHPEFPPRPKRERPAVAIPDDVGEMTVVQIQNELRSEICTDRARRQALWRRLDILTRFR